MRTETDIEVTCICGKPVHLDFDFVDGAEDGTDYDDSESILRPGTASLAEFVKDLLADPEIEDEVILDKDYQDMNDGEIMVAAVGAKNLLRRIGVAMYADVVRYACRVGKGDPITSASAAAKSMLILTRYYPHFANLAYDAMNDERVELHGITRQEIEHDDAYGAKTVFDWL